MILAALVVIVGLGLQYSRWAIGLPDGIRSCLAVPAQHDGTRLVFPVWFVAGVDGPQRYRISRVVKDVVVEGDSSALEAGQTITVVGVFRAADSVVVEERHQVHRWRDQKKQLSLLALVLAGLALPVFFRFRGGYLELRRGWAEEGGDA